MNDMFSFRVKSVLAVCVLALGVSGPALAKDKLKLGMPAKNFLNLVEYVAVDRGIFDKHNLEVEFVQIADSSIPVRALISGDLDISEAGMAETLAAVDKGGDLRTIGGVHTGLHYGFWVNRAAGIRDVRDLPGKKVGISSPGSLPHLVVVALMRQAGMTDAEIGKVTWVSMKGSAARINGVVAGTIDATVSGYDPKAARASTAELQFSVAKKLPQYVMTPWDVRVDTLNKKRDTIKRFIKAELEATRWIFTNKAAALEIAKKHFDYSPSDLEAFYEFYTTGGVWNRDGIVTPEEAQYMQQLNVEAKLQRAVQPTDKVLDTRLLQEVLGEVGRVIR
jgi:NitT/TauT family transport system substrate-binding protein